MDVDATVNGLVVPCLASEWVAVQDRGKYIVICHQLFPNTF